MNPKELEQIAHDVIAKKIDANEEVRMPWAVNEIIQCQGGISGNGVPFFSLCAREHVYRTVKKVVGKYEDAKKSDDEQLTLAGWNWLKPAYTFPRESEIRLLPIAFCTRDELLERAKQFESQGRGLFGHAGELRKYVKRREKGLLEDIA